MPIYQYKCENCSCEFELRKNFSDDSNHVKCPECGQATRRIFVPVGIIFKGSGFYVNDYPRSNTPPSASSDKTDKVAKPAAAEPVAPKTDSKSPATHK